MRLDLLHLVRTLRRSPASATAAVLTLSLTMGAAASILGVIDAALLTPPPFDRPDELVTLGEVPADDPGSAPRSVSAATFQAWKDRAGTRATLEAFDGTNVTLTGLGTAERLSATRVTPGFLTMLGVRSALGRTLGDDDAGQPVVVVSHDFWRDQLQADPSAVGRPLVLGGRPYTIVGVLPETFAFALTGGDLWLPLPAGPALGGVRTRGLARLGRDVSLVYLYSVL
jgi:putative ABC transport system permease protein